MMSRVSKVIIQGHRAAIWLGMAVFISCLMSVATASRAPIMVELINNQPFPLRMPVRLRDVNPGGGAWSTTANRPVQQENDDLIFIADVAPFAHERFSLRPGAPPDQATPFILKPNAKGVMLAYSGEDLGTLAWDIVAREMPEERGKQRGAPATTRADFAAQFEALPLSFVRSACGPVFDIWRAEATKSGLQLMVELDAYHAGFLDIRAQLINRSAVKRDGMYAAVVTRWVQPAVSSRAVNYDNHLASFGERSWAPFRAGEGRHLFVQRGVDWIRTGFAGNKTAVWLNDFAPSFTVHEEATQKQGAHYTGANIPQLGQEAQTAQGALYSITEIARPNIPIYRGRFTDNLLPPVGEPISFSSRLAFTGTPLSDERADQMFIAYVGYHEQHKSAGSVSLSYGVSGVRFGTNYFPYSTLGENFDALKLPGMDRDAYWPLAADTVTQWRLFADDIRRDLRIARAMGFELIRLHHLELLSPLDKQLQQEYLDFLFAEMKHLGLRALLDVRLAPEDVAALVARHRELISGVEIDNEVLIFGIPDDAPSYWQRVYAAVKRVAPEIPVHLTAHTNTGAFNRLSSLGVNFDRIGQHAYIDSVEAIPSARDFALAAADYGAKVGKPPVITEWNWRGLTRIRPEARAKIYAPIFENVLATRSIPELYQFQFQETLAVNPAARKGIRHYEQLWVSRRPKPEAFEMMRLIKKYSYPTAPNRMLDVEHVVVPLDGMGRGVAPFRVLNTSGRTLELHAAVETSANVSAMLERSSLIRLAPNASAEVPVTIALREKSDDLMPGFYHVFLRLEGDDGLVRYGWAEARMAGAPKIDRQTKTEVRYGDGALAFNFNRPVVVVYGDGAPIIEMETAYVLANTLESATGRPVMSYQLSDLSADARANGALIVIGTAQTNALVASMVDRLPHELRLAKQFVAQVPGDASRGDWLIVSGGEPAEAEAAGMDLTLRYWKFAKDSAARRIGVAAKKLPLGIDPGQLP